MNGTNWYLLQTNQDHFKGICPERCTAGRRMMDNLTQDDFNVFTGEDDVLDEIPLLNQASVYSTVMVPETGFFRANILNGTYVASDL